MPPSRMAQLALREVRRQARVLGIADWQIEVTIGESGHRAAIYTHPEYQRAELRLDPDLNADPADLDEAIRHELLHIVSSPIDLVHNTITVLHADGTPERRILDEQFRQVAEMLVVNLERMYHSLLKQRGRA